MTAPDADLPHLEKIRERDRLYRAGAPPGGDLHDVLAAAREHPGREVVILAPEDRDTLRAEAARHRRRADELDRQAAGYPDGAA